MKDNHSPAETDGKLTRVAFLNCHDATLFCDDVHLSNAEEAKLAGMLAWLQDAGVMLLPRPVTNQFADFNGVLASLRTAIGAPMLETAMAVGTNRPAALGGTPIAVMPVWPFDAEGGEASDPDVLLSSGRLWGADVLIEAFRVAGPDHPVPEQALRSRFKRWTKAAGGGQLRVAMKPPGTTKWYVLGAISGPA